VPVSSPNANLSKEDYAKLADRGLSFASRFGVRKRPMPQPHLPKPDWSKIASRGNLIAGLAVGVYLIPQAMAYGELAGIGPAAGLAMAIIPLLLYPLLGASRFSTVGPESAVALLAAVTVAPIALANPGAGLTIMATLTFLVGIAMIIARLLRAGAFADLLSRPALLGYMMGIASLLALSQFPKLVNENVETTSLPALVSSWIEVGSLSANWVNIGIVATVLVSALGIRRFIPRVPAIPVSLLIASLLGVALNAETIGRIASPIPTGLVLPSFGLVSQLLLPALAVTIVACTGSVLTTRAFAAPGERVNVNRELAAWGTIGILNSFTGAYPSSTSASRTAIAVSSGASNRFYSWPALLVMLGLTLAFPGALGMIPTAALAGVVMYAALQLVDIGALIDLARFRFREVALAATAAIGVLTVGVLPGIGITVALSVGELIMRLMRPHEAVLGFVPGIAGMHDIDDHEKAQQIPGLLVFRYDAPLFFANANDFRTQVMDQVEARPGTEWLILNMEANVEVDTSGLDALEQLHADLEGAGIHLVLARVKNDLRIPMERYGTWDLVGVENIFPELDIAVDAYCEYSGKSLPKAAHDDGPGPFPAE